MARREGGPFFTDLPCEDPRTRVVVPTATTISCFEAHTAILFCQPDCGSIPMQLLMLEPQDHHAEQVPGAQLTLLGEQTFQNPNVVCFPPVNVPAGAILMVQWQVAVNGQVWVAAAALVP